MTSDGPPSGLPPPPGGYPFYLRYEPPPGDSDMPWGVRPAPGGSHAGLPVVRAGVLQEENPMLVVALTLVTCGIYSLYWHYTRTRELRDALDEPSLNPSIDVLLALPSCGLWLVYAHYRNARLLHRALLRFEPDARDRSAAIVVLDLATVLVLVTWLIALFVLQDEHNHLARLADGRR
ncbi:MAG: DUF4234 domain-containing protein [Polyangiaceae bacterium]